MGFVKISKNNKEWKIDQLIRKKDIDFKKVLKIQKWFLIESLT